MTGLYSASMNAGGALAAAMSAPTSHFIGRTFDVDATMAWPLALFVWVIPVLLATSLWQAPGLERGPSNNAKRVLWKDIGRNRLAWSVTLFFGFQASLAYIVYGWLGWVLRNRGCSAVEAGLAVAVSVVCQSLASIIFPFLSRRWRSQRCPNVIAIFATCISLIGCLYAPVGLVSVCAVMLGLAQGTAFTLALTVIGLRSDTTDVAEALSSMAQGVGYGVAGIGPFIAGFLLRSAESMNGLAYLCIIIGLLAAFFGFLAGKNAAVTVRAD